MPRAVRQACAVSMSVSMDAKQACGGMSRSDYAVCKGGAACAKGGPPKLAPCTCARAKQAACAQNGMPKPRSSAGEQGARCSRQALRRKLLLTNACRNHSRIMRASARQACGSRGMRLRRQASGGKRRAHACMNGKADAACSVTGTPRSSLRAVALSANAPWRPIRALTARIQAVRA
jgi:hypothetical protein